MVDMALQKNVASLITTRLASAFTAMVAGGANDNTPVVGPAFQRSLIGMPRNAAIVLLWAATLAATKSLTLGTVKIQDSADGATWTDFQTLVDPGVVATGPGGGGAVSGSTLLQASLGGARDYVRLVFTPDLTAANTDTGTVVAALIFAGGRTLPAAA